jgi:hypothetical protein
MSTSTLHPLSRFLPTSRRADASPARALGWFSIGLGLAELADAETAGAHRRRAERADLTRIFGLREIGTGIGILTSKDPSPWLWGRVAGDALDSRHRRRRPRHPRPPLRTLTSVAMLLGIAWVDLKVAEKAPPARKLEKRSSRDYTGRSGFPRSAAEMRGVALRPSTPMGRPQGPAAPMAGSPVQAADAGGRAGRLVAAVA